MGQLNKDALLEISQDPRQYGFAVTFPIYVAEATRVSAREPLTARHSRIYAKAINWR